MSSIANVHLPNHAGAATAPLRLAAFDADDVAVVSAHFQDALVRASDMAWLPAAKRFALAAQRFDWPGAASGRLQRRLAGLHVDHVTGVASTGYAPGEAATLLNILAISFEPGEAPAGHVRITFSGGAALRLAVDCLEAGCGDLGPSWPAQACPGHGLSGTGHGLSQEVAP